MNATRVLGLLAFTILKARTLSCFFYNVENNLESVLREHFFWDGLQLFPVPSCYAAIYLMDVLEIAAPSNVTGCC